MEPYSGQKIIYCVTDNAGNVTRGQYPEVAVNYYGCFADGTMNPLPNLSTYTPPLVARITGNIFGYSLTDGSRAAQNAAFQTRLTQNISTYITAQHEPTTFSASTATMSLNLSNTPGAFIDNTSTPNTN